MVTSNYEISYYHPRVRAEIMEWPAGILADFARIAELLSEFGPFLGMPHARNLGAGLFELRAKGREGIARSFYCCLDGRQVVILHSFVKKTRSIPARHLQIARSRHKLLRHA